MHINLYFLPRSLNVHIRIIPDKEGKLSWKTVMLSLKMSRVLFVFVEVLRPSQPNGVMSSAVSLPNHTFTGQA